jgi:hypothetical protein
MIHMNRTLFATLALGLVAGSQAQIPDLLSAFDAGGRSLGMGTSIGVTSANTTSALNNPAGLGFVNSSQLSLTFKNLNESKTSISRRLLPNGDFESSATSGKRSLTHVGFTKPLGKRGTLGISYTVGGFIRDLQTGTNLVEGGTTFNDYRRTLKAKTDFFTLSVGRSNSDFTRSFGIGIVLANSYAAENIISNVSNGSNFSVLRSDTEGSTYGVGFVVGTQLNLSGDLTLGLSARTPISLSGDDESEAIYDKIPGRVSAGLAKRIQNPRRSEDFIIAGLQGDYYFGGSDKRIIERGDSQFAGGFGFEYNYRLRNAYIPFRIGFRTIQKGGTGFSNLSGFNYGIGYNPDSSNLGIELDFGNYSGGGRDMSLSLSYRFKN